MKEKGENTPTEWRKGEYAISTETARIDLAFVHDFLSRTNKSASPAS